MMMINSKIKQDKAPNCETEIMISRGDFESDLFYNSITYAIQINMITSSRPC